MMKQFFIPVGFFFCLLANYPVCAEPPVDEGYRLGEPTNASVEANRDAKLPSVLTWKLTPYSPATESIFDWPTLSASNNETFQSNTNSHHAANIGLNFPTTVEPNIEENVFLTPSIELRRNTNYRWNVGDAVALGIGVVDEKPVPVELEKIALQEAALNGQTMLPTGVSQENYDWRVNLNFQPSSQFGVNFDGNYLSSQFGINWQPVPGLTFTGSRHNQNETLAGGVQISQKNEDFGFSARANLDSEDRWRWGVSSNLGNLQLSYQTNGDPNGLGTNSQLGYRLIGGAGSAHQLRVGYETRDSEGTDNRLTTFGWRFQSGQDSSKDSAGWEFDLGYGIGSQGEGWVTSISAPLNRGLVLRARYQGVSLNSDSETFKLEILPFGN